MAIRGIREKIRLIQQFQREEKAAMPKFSQYIAMKIFHDMNGFWIFYLNSRLKKKLVY